MIQNKYIKYAVFAALVVGVGLFVLRIISEQNSSAIAYSGVLSPKPATTTYSGFNSSTPPVAPEPVSPYRQFLSDVETQKFSDKSTISLQFFGDIMLDRNVAKVMGKSGLDYIFDNLKKPEDHLFGGTDLLIANLEGPFAQKRVPTSKSIAFRFDPILAAQLNRYGFSGVSLANNHTYDMGRANVAFTRETLKKADIGFFGDELIESKDLTWYWATPTTSEAVPVTIAFIGLHNTYHNLDLVKTEAAIKDATEKADYVVVNIHWGEEYERISNKKQRDRAHWLIDKGVDVVIGHHPHVIEEMEIYKDKPIFYSLGNFIFDQYFSKDTQEGLSVGLTFANGKVAGIYLFPFYSVKSQVYPMKDKRRDEFLTWMSKNSRLGDKKITAGKIDL